MSTTDTGAAFEAWALTCDGNCNDQDLRKYSSGHPNHVVDGIDYINQQVERDRQVWQAATEAANKQAAEPIGWIIGDFPTRCRASFEMNGMVMHSHRCGAATTPVYTAAKATGTAGEPNWPELPSLIFGMVDDAVIQLPKAHAVKLLREYGQQCAEAARQPAPVLQVSELAKKLNALDMAIAHSTNLTPHSKPRRLLAAIIHEICSDAALAATAAPVLSDAKHEAEYKAITEIISKAYPRIKGHHCAAITYGILEHMGLRHSKLNYEQQESTNEKAQ